MTKEEVIAKLIDKAKDSLPVWAWIGKTSGMTHILLVAKKDADSYYHLGDPAYPVFCSGNNELTWLQDYYTNNLYLLVATFDVNEEYEKNKYSNLTSISTLKAWILKLDREQVNILEGVNMRPEMDTAKAEYEEALKEFKAAEKALRDDRQILVKNIDRRPSLRGELIILESQKVQKVFKPNFAIEEWHKETKRGKGDTHTKIVWQSEDGRFGIMYKPGTTYWSGRSSQSYAQSQCFLFDIKDEKHNLWGNGIIHEFEEGRRFTKLMVAEAEQMINKVK